jgi:hypothetical protein
LSPHRRRERRQRRDCREGLSEGGSFH